MSEDKEKQIPIEEGADEAEKVKAEVEAQKALEKEEKTKKEKKK